MLLVRHLQGFTQPKTNSWSLLEPTCTLALFPRGNVGEGTAKSGALFSCLARARGPGCARKPGEAAVRVCVSKIGLRVRVRMQYLNCGLRAQFPLIMLSNEFYAQRALTFRAPTEMLARASATSSNIPSSLGIDNGPERQNYF